MRLRPFRPDDLQTLYEIDQACFAPGISYTREELTAFIGHRHSQTWVAEEAGEITGFLIAQREPRKILHIVTIDVLEAWRRRGVGSLLMEAAEQWAQRSRSAHDRTRNRPGQSCGSEVLCRAGLPQSRRDRAILH